MNNPAIQIRFKHDGVWGPWTRHSGNHGELEIALATILKYRKRVTVTYHDDSTILQARKAK